MKRTGICLGTLLLAAAASLAAAPPEVCDQTDSGERIKCKVGNVVSQQMGAAEMIDQMDLVPATQEDALLREVDRAMRAQVRTEAKQFKQLTKKASVSCQVSELIGDGKGDDDGICTMGEDCEEVIGDQIGDDDGICRPMNGRNREVCVEICDADIINDDPDNFDDDPLVDSRGRDLEESLDTLTEQYEELNKLIEDDMFARDAFLATVGDRAAGGACETLIRNRPNTTTVAILVGAADGARIAADIAERYCDQTAFGVNGAAACSVVEGIAGAARVVATAYQFEGADIDSLTIDAIYACAAETRDVAGMSAGAIDGVSDDVAAVASQISRVEGRVDDVDMRVGVVDSKVEVLQAQVERVQAALDYAIHLLNLPPGQRPNYPDGTQN